jgi:hypothetical protein
MKKVICLVSLVILSSCAIPVQKHRVLLEKPRVVIPKTRAENYKSCVLDFSREGIKQSLIKELCDSTLGSID